MAPPLPDEQARFAQVALEQGFVSPEQIRSALELFHRYQTSGGEVPSIGRILVARKLVSLRKAEALLRHVLNGEPLPAVSSEPLPEENSIGLPEPEPEAEISDELGLGPPGSAIELPVHSDPDSGEFDEQEALIQGLGATVLRKDLREIKGYKITQVIGEGSMGIVYKAHQISMDRTVALKVLPAEKTNDPRFIEAFKAEARNAGRLNHPNLIRVHEVGKQGDTYFYSMEYVEGQRLDEWMDECEGGRLDPKEAVSVFAQIAAALDYGFRSQVIHREIRPNTIMLCEDKQAKLSDLGLTRDEEKRFLDGENACYVAPEQALRKPADTRADIYALGCCLFHALTGEPPFQGGGPKDVLQRRLSLPTPNPRDFNPELPVDLASIVMKMMARDPRARYQTPAEVCEALKTLTFAIPPTTRGVKPLTAKFVKRPIRAPQGAARRPIRRRYRG